MTPCVPVLDFCFFRKALADGELLVRKSVVLDVFYEDLVVITRLGYQPHLFDGDWVYGAAAVVDVCSEQVYASA